MNVVATKTTIVATESEENDKKNVATQNSCCDIIMN